MCFLFLAAFSWVVDVKQHRGIAFPLVVVGMNSIAAYVMAEICRNFVESSFRIHLGPVVLNCLGPGMEPTLVGVLTMIAYWLVLYLDVPEEDLRAHLGPVLAATSWNGTEPIETCLN